MYFLHGLLHYSQQANELKPPELRLTKNWVRGFLTRHPEVVPKPRRKLDIQRVEACSKQAMAEFFDKMKSEIKPDE